MTLGGRRLRAFMLFVMALPVLARPATASTGHAAQPNWQSRQVSGYTLYFTDENAGEIDAVAAILREFEQTFCRVTGAPPELYARNRVKIYFYPSGSTEVGVGFISLDGGPRVEGSRHAYVGTIKMPGPRAYNGTQSSSSWHPMDRRFFDKTLVHEVAPVYLELLARNSGTRFNYAFPAWFEQGLEEYFAVLHSTPYWRTEGIKTYYRRLRQDAVSIDTEFGLNLRDPYNDGFVVLHFIRDEFGEKAILDILRSKEPSFGGKLRKALGVPFADFLGRFEKWREARITAGQ